MAYTKPTHVGFSVIWDDAASAAMMFRAVSLRVALPCRLFCLRLNGDSHVPSLCGFMEQIPSLPTVLNTAMVVELAGP